MVERQKHTDGGSPYIHEEEVSFRGTELCRSAVRSLARDAQTTDAVRPRFPESQPPIIAMQREGTRTRADD